jgi:hypothetical protein
MPGGVVARAVGGGGADGAEKGELAGGEEGQAQSGEAEVAGRGGARGAEAGAVVEYDAVVQRAGGEAGDGGEDQGLEEELLGGEEGGEEREVERGVHQRRQRLAAQAQQEVAPSGDQAVDGQGEGDYGEGALGRGVAVAEAQEGHEQAREAQQQRCHGRLDIERPWRPQVVLGHPVDLEPLVILVEESNPAADFAHGGRLPEQIPVGAH